MTCEIVLASTSQHNEERGDNIRNYIDFHLHTELSLLDSTTNYKDYVDKAVELGQKAICFTEHGNTYNWVEKKLYCEEKGIKYMHGVEVYLTESHENKARDNYHTILIAKNYEGFKELNALIDMSTDERHTYYKPRLSFDEFLNISDNIIKTSACIQSPLYQLPLVMKERGDDSLALYYEKLIGVYDYLEVQPHEFQDQKDFNEKLLKLSKATGTPLIAGADTHSLDKYKAECRTMLQYGKDIFFGAEDECDLSYKSYEEFVEMFKKQGVLPEEEYLTAIENTNILADSVEEFELDLSFKYPKIEGDEEKLFMDRVNKMYQEKKQKGIIQGNQTYTDNIKEEFRVLKKIGMLSFMYFMSELCCWCQQNDIPYGFCRGSVGGSYIAYILDIIDVNPFVWGTKFSRFANEDRVEIGDIDLDFFGEDREVVYKYIIDRFGNDKTAFILTTNTLADKGAIDDIVRGFANKYRRDNKLDKKAETPYSINYAVEIKRAFEENEEDARNKYKEIFYYFDGMRGSVVSKGIHPAGIVASPISLPDNYGTFWNDGNRVMCINMEEIHEVSLVKYDILGLKNVGIIKETCKLADIPYPKSHEINWQDEKVWADMITSNVAVFQFESRYSFDLLKKFKPQKVNDMSLVNAALRPSGESYRDSLIARIANKNPSAIIDNLLKDNNGYLVFQEDVTKFLQDICGLSGNEADNVRRAIGRKQLDRLQAALPQILEGYCLKSDKPRVEAEEEAKVFLKIIEDASDYMFGYNHSTGYSMIGYVCSYLRYYYPAEFIAVYLNLAKDESDITDGTELAKIKGVNIRGVKFRYSQWEYFISKDENAVYKGLSSVKFMNETVATSLFELRNATYSSFVSLLVDLNYKTTINTRQLDILIKIGFFEEFGDINKLLKVTGLYQSLYKKKSIKKDQIELLGISEGLVEKFSNKETDTRVDEIDSIAFIKSIGLNKSDLEDCIKYKYEKIDGEKTKIPNGYSSKKVFKKYEMTDKQKAEFSTKTVIGSFAEIDMVGMAKEYEKIVEVPNSTISELAKYQCEFLGYVDYMDDNLEWRYVVVTDLDTKYSPKFKAYCLSKGNNTQMKVSNRLNNRNKAVKTAFTTTPFENGDILYLTKVEQQPRKRKTENGFEDVPGEFDWWVREYKKVDM